MTIEIRIADLPQWLQREAFAIRRKMRDCYAATPGTRVWIRSDLGQDGRKILGQELIAIYSQ